MRIGATCALTGYYATLTACRGDGLGSVPLDPLSQVIGQADDGWDNSDKSKVTNRWALSATLQAALGGTYVINTFV